ncbi:MAG TPA: ABC transporter permease [Acidimicrobiales bacterium]|nr:ABC transporter permease [Acidimicrobiales bacterium]
MTRRALAVTRVALGRYLADRRALLFMLVLPVAVILIVGATVSGVTKFRVGVVNLGAGAAGADLSASLHGSALLKVTDYHSIADARTALTRGEILAAAIIPVGLDATLARGDSAQVAVMTEPNSSDGQAALADIGSIVSDLGSQVQAAAFATVHGHGTYAANLALARSRDVALVTVGDKIVQAHEKVLPQGFSYSAPTELVLFVFLNTLAAGAFIIDTRRLGMYERMAAAPLRPVAIVAGETLTYVAIALVQSALIVFVGTIVFGVSWGDPLAALALVVTWAFVGAGAGMLSGTLFRTPEQATAVGPALGIALAMLGGCMWPLAITTKVMQTAGHFTPHAWAVDAWTALLSRHGTLLTIGREIGVLVLFAAGLLCLATIRLRRLLA